VRRHHVTNATIDRLVGERRLARLVFRRAIGTVRLAFDDRGHLWLYVAMQRVGVAALKGQLSKHLRAVEAGGELEVTDRDRPIARIVPVHTHRQSAVRPALRPFSAIRHRRYRPAGWRVSSTELLLQERQGR